MRRLNDPKPDPSSPPEEGTSHLAKVPGAYLHGLLSQLGIADLVANGDETRVEPATRPFLTVVTRTQARRLHTLKETLLSLAAQTVHDFEVVVVGHKLDEAKREAVLQLMRGLPDGLRDRVRLVPLETGNRAAPLNAGFQAAQGRYIAILDDDDIPFAHWVETFRTGAERAPGRIVRTVCVRQEFDEVHTAEGTPTVRAVSGMHRDYPPAFDLFEHLRVNRTPNHALAFPRSIFHDLGLRFDDSLTTTEDWDFLMRAAFVCGVEGINEITCIYRWWRHSESSRTVHDEREWSENLDRILARFDEQYLLLPPGTVSRLRDAALGFSSSSGTGISASQAELLEVLHSKGWAVTAPLRIVGHHLMGNPRPVATKDVLRMSASEAREMLGLVKASKSYKVADQLRALSARVKARLR